MINICMLYSSLMAVLLTAGCHSGRKTVIVTAPTPPPAVVVATPPAVVVMPPGDMRPVVKPRPEPRTVVLITPPPPVMRPNPEPKILMDLQPGVPSPIIRRPPDNPHYMMLRPRSINAPYKPPRSGR